MCLACVGVHPDKCQCARVRRNCSLGRSQSIGLIGHRRTARVFKIEMLRVQQTKRPVPLGSRPLMSFSCYLAALRFRARKAAMGSTYTFDGSTGCALYHSAYSL